MDPPVATLYQLILFPVDVAFKTDDKPVHNEEGVAVKFEGVVGKVDTVKPNVFTVVHPLLSV